MANYLKRNVWGGVELGGAEDYAVLLWSSYQPISTQYLALQGCFRASTVSVYIQSLSFRWSGESIGFVLLHWGAFQLTLPSPPMTSQKGRC